jgi:pimeloyl-ACP methyl ester carboxylesterase
MTFGHFPADRRAAVCLGLLLAALFFVPARTSQAQSQTEGLTAGPYDAYTGVYRAGPDHMIGVTRFITDSRQDTILISDYQSGVVRRLFQVADGEFVMGPGFAVKEPAELTVRFIDDADGDVTRVSLEPAGGETMVADRVPLRVDDIVIDAGEATLSGTLMIPPGEGPHPAIVLLHGSGPLTRWSFGPYPHFFTSLGFATLIYDKRGTGDSTGVRLDASSGALATMPDAYYPDGLVNDAQAVFDHLRQRSEIDPETIGFWGSSEGGMLSTQVAAREPDVAFAIDSSGFMGPLWETLAYQVEPILVRDGYPEDVEEAQELTELWMRVARTGEDYELFLHKREEALAAGKPWLLSYTSDEFTSLEQMRWAWDHILVFDPLPALADVEAPVLAVFGDVDPLTDAEAAASAMEEALSGRDFTARIFPNAGHSLSEQPGGARMAPGVFDTLRTWLRERVTLTEPAAE